MRYNKSPFYKKIIFKNKKYFKIIQQNNKIKKDFIVKD